MSAEVAYLDTSAFVKTIAEEHESHALSQYLQSWSRRASSKLLRVEALRAIRRISPEKLALTRAALQKVELIDIDDAVIDYAAELDPPALRSLDAIHLATAELLGRDLGVVITYDERMASGARTLGFEVASPG